jgi:hypothetical protein
MCWYSAAHSGQELLQADVGQRLGVPKMHSGACWVVKEGELEMSRPAPVCLLDGTRALFRPTETEQATLQIGSEPEAAFHTRGHSKRDVFEFQEGRQVEVNQLPTGLILDVLLVPGSEHLSGVLNPQNERERLTIMSLFRRGCGTCFELYPDPPRRGGTVHLTMIQEITFAELCSGFANARAAIAGVGLYATVADSRAYGDRCITPRRNH